MYRWTLGGGRFPESLEPQNLRTGRKLKLFRSTFYPLYPSKQALSLGLDASSGGELMTCREQEGVVQQENSQEEKTSFSTS